MKGGTRWSSTVRLSSFTRKDPAGYVKKNATKRLAAIAKLAFEVVPQDPTRPEYRQGNTLGDEHKHWFRAKFFQQYRLFFRFHAQAKVVVFAWVNDEDTSGPTRALTTPIGCSAGCSTAADRRLTGANC